jgi:hypothetical protein
MLSKVKPLLITAAVSILAIIVYKKFIQPKVPGAPMI